MGGPIVTKSSHSLVVSVLRQGLSELTLRDGNVLHARLSGSLPINTDVENALLYNVGGFGELMRNGVRFELGDEPTEGNVRYRYRVRRS